ncbi:MAG: hypothetical protein AAGI34_15140, partial [Pseudomonadota bacterium]
MSATAFDRALAVLHTDPNLSLPATYTPANGDPPFPVRLVLRREEEPLSFGAARILSSTEPAKFEVRVGEIAAPAEGDVIELGDGTRYVVQGAPVRDAEGLLWLLDTSSA